MRIPHKNRLEIKYEKTCMLIYLSVQLESNDLGLQFSHRY